MTTFKLSNVAAIAAIVLCTTTAGFGLRQALSQQSADDPFGAPGGSGLVLDQGADAASGGATGADPFGVVITDSGATADPTDPFDPGAGGGASGTVGYSGGGSTYASAQSADLSTAFEMKGEGEAQVSITRALNEPATLQYVDIPLDDVMNDLSTRHNMHIEIDRNALADVGIDSSTLVTASYRGLTLRTALRLMLESLELTYIVGDEYLLITTRDVAEHRLDTRIYPIRLQWAVAPNDLITAMVATIHPHSWDENGGPGNLKPLGQNLIITQTQEVHESIVDLLMQLERAAKFRADLSTDSGRGRAGYGRGEGGVGPRGSNSYDGGYGTTGSTRGPIGSGAGYDGGYGTGRNTSGSSGNDGASGTGAAPVESGTSSGREAAGGGSTSAGDPTSYNSEDSPFGY